jgi:polyisoprenoid-binding protein YceI
MIRSSPRLLTSSVIVAWILLLLSPADVQAQRVAATVDSTASVIDYTGSATMHDWTGTSRSVSGTMVLNSEVPDSSQVVIRAPVASFESGPDRRDRRMREVTEAEQYPTVEFRSTDIRPQEWGATSEGHAGKWAVTGDLTFHGQTHPVEAAVEVRVTADSVRAHAQFPVSLTRFDVERPELLWVAPIGDTIRIDARIAGTIESTTAEASRLTDKRSAMTDTRQIASANLRTITARQYAGRSAHLRAEARLPSGGAPEWILAFYGFADQPTGMSSAQTITVRADGQTIDPRQVEGTTRTLDDGTAVEISRLYFSRASFAALGEALTVTTRIGSARFSADWQARRDLRLILEEASADSSRQYTATDDP